MREDNEMLKCEGYKMFVGTATITPKAANVKPFEILGTWLYKPEFDCWYVNGRSFSASIVSNIKEV